jgi:hypothetical protein
LVIIEKNSADWPMKSPSAVRALSAPIAAPSVWVGRMMEHLGNLRSIQLSCLRARYGPSGLEDLAYAPRPISNSGRVPQPCPVRGSVAASGS